MVCEHNIQERFIISEETWPPDQPTYFTPLTLVYHQSQYTSATATTQLIQTNDVTSGSVNSNQSVPKHCRTRLDSYEPSLKVTGFAKKSLPHTSNFHTLTVHNFPSE